nr:hypothetical protein [Tanacetum cinerariifolium]
MGNALVPASSFAPKPKNPLTPKKDNLAKDAICNQCGEVGNLFMLRNDVTKTCQDLAMCDFSYDALCTHWLSLKGVTLLCSVSRFIVTASIPKTHVTRPRPTKTIVTKPHSPLRRHINSSQSSRPSNFSPKVTAAKAPMVNAVKGNWGNPQHALKDKRVIDSGCSRHMTGSMSYLSDFEEINGGYVAFGGNLKGGKISGKGSGPTWLFDIDTLTKTMNYQPVTAGNQSNPSAGVQEQIDAEKAREDNVQQYVLFFLWSSGSKNPQNTDDDAAFGGKKTEFEGRKPEFKGRKPESEVHVSPSSKFEDFSDNNINEVNAADSPVPAIEQISTNSTNTFNAAGPSNTDVSPTHGKYSFVDTSQYPDDPNMSELEDITYSDDEEDV